MILEFHATEHVRKIKCKRKLQQKERFHSGSIKEQLKIFGRLLMKVDLKNLIVTEQIKRKRKTASHLDDVILCIDGGKGRCEP